MPARSSSAAGSAPIPDRITLRPPRPRRSSVDSSATRPVESITSTCFIDRITVRSSSLTESSVSIATLAAPKNIGPAIS